MEYFRRTGFTVAQWKELKAHASEVGVGFLSSPFSEPAVDLLEEIGVDSYKIPWARSQPADAGAVAATGSRPICRAAWATGTSSTLPSAALRPGGPLVVMQCSSAYPCPPERVGLNVIGEMAARWGLPVGFSDHTLGPAAAIAAVAVGPSPSRSTSRSRG